MNRFQLDFDEVPASRGEASRYEMRVTDLSGDIPLDKMLLSPSFKTNHPDEPDQRRQAMWALGDMLSKTLTDKITP